MQELWGYKLAWECTDKSSRACYRFAKQSACLYDKSYLVPLLVKAKTARILDELLIGFGILKKYPWLARLTPGFSDHDEFTRKMLRFLIIDDPKSEYARIISSCCVLVRPKAAEPLSVGQEVRCLLFIHPSAAAEVEGFIVSSFSHLAIETQALPGRINTFEIIGEDAYKLLFSVLEPLARDREGSFSQQFTESLGRRYGHEDFEGQSTFFLKIRNPGGANKGF